MAFDTIIPVYDGRNKSIPIRQKILDTRVTQSIGLHGSIIRFVLCRT